MLRLMPNVRQTAALVAPPSSAAMTAASFSVSIGNRSTAMTSAAACRGEPGLHPLLDQRPFELRQRAEYVEQELALRRRGVHLLGQRAKGDAALP